MKKLLVEIWLGIVSLIYPDPERKRDAEEQREAQMMALIMLAFIGLVGYAYAQDWLQF